MDGFHHDQASCGFEEQHGFGTSVRNSEAEEPLAMWIVKALLPLHMRLNQQSSPRL